MSQESFASVFELCSALNTRAAQQASQEAIARARKFDALQKIQVAACNSPGIIPSGPRRQGEGCDDEDQGIVGASETSTGGAKLLVTLLAAGFLIGPGGASIRAVSQKTGADIRSWSETCPVQGKLRRVRTIVVEGSRQSVIIAVSILNQAVERYKLLCEGKFCGKAVEKSQFIQGVEFFYSPPPRSAVPFAAALKVDYPTSPLSRSAITSPKAAIQKENVAALAAAKKSSRPPPPPMSLISSVTNSSSSPAPTIQQPIMMPSGAHSRPLTSSNIVNRSDGTGTPPPPPLSSQNENSSILFSNAANQQAYMLPLPTFMKFPPPPPPPSSHESFMHPNQFNAAAVHDMSQSHMHQPQQQQHFDPYESYGLAAVMMQQQQQALQQHVLQQQQRAQQQQYHASCDGDSASSLPHNHTHNHNQHPAMYMDGNKMHHHHHAVQQQQHQQYNTMMPFFPSIQDSISAPTTTYHSMSSINSSAADIQQLYHRSLYGIHGMNSMYGYDGEYSLFGGDGNIFGPGIVHTDGDNNDDDNGYNTNATVVSSGENTGESSSTHNSSVIDHQQQQQQSSTTVHDAPHFNNNNGDNNNNNDGDNINYYHQSLYATAAATMSNNNNNTRRNNNAMPTAYAMQQPSSSTLSADAASYIHTEESSSSSYDDSVAFHGRGGVRSMPVAAVGGGAFVVQSSGYDQHDDGWYGNQSLIGYVDFENELALNTALFDNLDLNEEGTGGDNDDDDDDDDDTAEVDVGKDVGDE